LTRHYYSVHFAPSHRDLLHSIAKLIILRADDENIRYIRGDPKSSPKINDSVKANILELLGDASIVADVDTAGGHGIPVVPIDIHGVVIAGLLSVYDVCA
jgi:hypothetical protein